MKQKIILIIALCLINACNTQNINNNIMSEKYDFETVKNSKTDPAVVKKGKWTILMYSMFEDGGTYVEYPPTPEFYKITKFFYPNGMIKERGKVIGQVFPCGTWEYFDEKGNLVKEENLDEKLGKIKPNDILRFLEKEGWINLTTGEGREYPVLDGNNYEGIEECRFSLSFVNDNDNQYWNIFIQSAAWNNYYHTIYHLDINTGEVLSKETIYSPIEI
jgi:hypothetical protein